MCTRKKSVEKYSHTKFFHTKDFHSNLWRLVSLAPFTITTVIELNYFDFLLEINFIFFFTHLFFFPLSATQITDMIAKLDNLTKYIQQRLIDYKLEKRVNVIHVSDHGMNSVSSPSFIDLTKYLNNGTYEMYGTSPVLQIVPKNKGEFSIRKKKHFIVSKYLIIFVRLQT